MQKISPFQYRKTSVSLPIASYRRMKSGQLILRRHGVIFFDDEMYRRLFKYFLKNWRGRGRKSATLRRYNADGKKYCIRPLYINQVLYSALWERAIHTGESVSRMLDVAIRVYLPRMIEEFLRNKTHNRKRSYDVAYWAARYEQRTKKYPDFFINYRCTTDCNSSTLLDYRQESHIISKAGLSPMQILDVMAVAT